jgi:superfamily II DNA or RNA helicase
MITDLLFREWCKSINNCNNWNSIQEALINNNFLDTQFHEYNYNSVKGYIFEHLIKYMYSYLNHKVYLYKDIPLNLKQELNLPNTDKGIDIIVNIKNEWVGIQCKWRCKTNNSLLKHFVTDFIYSINETKLSYGIMCTNVKNITPDFNKISNLKWITYTNLCELITSQVINYVKNITIVDPITKTTNNIKLRDYQIEAITKLINDSTPRKQCIMACGTGKTVVMIEYIKDIFTKNKNAKVLMLFPSLQLVSQTYNRINNELKKEILCICSDMDAKSLTVGEATTIEEEEIYNEFLATDHNKMYTTNIDIIKKDLKKKDIILCSYQSSKLLENQEFDVCVYDEAHKTVNNPTFNYTINDDNCKVKTRVFFTATPRYYKGANDNCISMCDENKYGKEIYNYSFKTARDEKYLLDFQILSYVVNDILLNDLIEEKYVKNDKLENVDSNMIIAAIQLAQHIQAKTNNSKKILTYHNTISKAEQFKKTLNYIFKKFSICANIYVMSGKTRMHIRKDIIHEFEKDSAISIICSSKVLNEGVDIPIVDTIVFVDSRKSTIDVTQCVGRGLRLHNDVILCTIIIPIMYEKLEENHNFTPLINILTAMNEIDNKIIEYFTLKNPNMKIMIKNMSNIMVDNFCNANNIKHKLEYVLKNLETRVTSSNQLCWEFKKTLLFEYCNINKMLPLNRTIYKNYRIGEWLCTQKRNINDNKSNIYVKLSENKYISDSLEKYLKYKNNKKSEKNTLTFEEREEILFKNANSGDEKEIEYIKYNIGQWFENKKYKIKDENCDIYKEFSTNIYIKQKIDKYLKNRDPPNTKKSYLCFNEMKKILFEYADINKLAPSYNTYYKDYNIYNWLKNQTNKISDIECIIYKELSENIYIKNNIKIEQDLGKRKLKFNEMKDLLFEYTNINNRAPNFNTIYKEYNIGSWLQHQKNKIGKNNYTKYEKLCQNVYIKENIKNFIKKTQKKEEINFNEMKNLIFEYISINKIVPPVNTIYKGINIGKWVQGKKHRINNKYCNDDSYKQLLENIYIKDDFEKYLKYINKKDPEKKALNFNEMKKLVFEYINNNNNVPKQKTIYKTYNIGKWLFYQKNKIKNRDCDIYMQFSNNHILKENIDKYLMRKNIYF